ncbi:MAG: carbon storage regulator [Pirellulales bacterium]|jgi:carbon storage regulator|nr:carbon storage regulator [Pirellulales bacterium]
MLVLSRKQGERIVVGGNIEIIVTELSGNRVRIGVSAPLEVSIRRGELKAETDQEADVADPWSACI